MEEYVKKVGVVITCHNREQHLKRTLFSSKTIHDDCHIVVVHDGCTNPSTPTPPVTDILFIDPPNRTWVNPVVAYNKGINLLLDCHSPDIIIFQNAECYHVGDVISYAATHITDSNYISFGCFNIDTPGDYDLATLLKANDRGATNKSGHAWYNHPVHRPKGYDFCAAISTSNMIKLNGFDERFKDDLGFADDDLVRRVRRLGLNLTITSPPDPFVVHQYHTRGNRRSPVQDKNRALASTLKHTGNYRATHAITKDFV